MRVLIIDLTNYIHEFSMDKTVRNDCATNGLVVALIFTEKDPSKVKKPSFEAMFGKLGSSLILSVFQKDGGIFGCQVAHSAHTKQGFSAVGEIEMVEFEIVGGNVTGEVSTGKELDAFGEKWQVDEKGSSR